MYFVLKEVTGCLEVVEGSHICCAATFHAHTAHFSPPSPQQADPWVECNAQASIDISLKDVQLDICQETIPYKFGDNRVLYLFMLLHCPTTMQRGFLCGWWVSPIMCTQYPSSAHTMQRCCPSFNAATLCLFFVGLKRMRIQPWTP